MEIVTIEINATCANYWQIIEQIEALTRPFILILYYKSFDSNIPFTWRLRATMRLRTLIIHDGVKVITVGQPIFNQWMREWLAMPYIVDSIEEAQKLADKLKSDLPVN